MTENYSKIVFRGYRRVFFLILALALLAQLSAFMYNRAQTALTAVTDDFSIVLVAPKMSLDDAQNFAAKLASGTDSVNTAQVLSIEDAFNSFKESNPEAAANVSPIMSGFLPQYIKLGVGTEVILNPQVWLQENIYAANPDITAVFKQKQANLVIYLDGLLKMAMILVLAAAFALIAFGFFVEAYYTKISSFRERAGGFFSAALAYIISFGAAYALVYPLNLLTTDFKYCLFSYSQLIIIALCGFMGWTLAKWKKF